MDDTDKAEMQELWGSVQGAMYTLYLATNGGDHWNYAYGSFSFVINMVVICCSLSNAFTAYMMDSQNTSSQIKEDVTVFTIHQFDLITLALRPRGAGTEDF